MRFSGDESKNASVVKKLLLASIALALTVASLEIGARSWLWLRPPVGHIGRWDFRSKCPPAYREAEYFSTEFLAESMTCLRDFVNPANTNFCIPGDYKGRFINISDGRRRTEFQPETVENHVLLFGGSTIFGRDVPDHETVASQLQLLINNSPGPQLAVENYGVPAMNAAQQLGRLQTLVLRPGDIVIFYDGVNDVFYPIYNGNLCGWLPGSVSDGGVRKLNLIQRATNEAFIRYGSRSGLVRLLFIAQQGTAPQTIVDDETLNVTVELSASAYRAALETSMDFATRSGASFFHFVQPNIFTLARRTVHEDWLIENELKSLPGLDRAFTVGYPRLQRAAAEACGSSNTDASDILDDRPCHDEVYLDFCHVNHVANRMIAKRIFETVFPSRSSAGGSEGIASRSASSAR